LLGVIVLGTAGAFGYRAMFGGSLIPSLPPIIKADGTPNKIIPAGNSANSSGQATASTGGDKLVSREEKPVDVPAPAATPRVVSTIPVFPDPNAGMQSSMVPGAPNMATQNMPGAVANGLAGGGAAGGAMSPLGPTAAPVYGGTGAAGAGVAPAGLPPGAAPQGSAMPTQPPVAGTANSKKIHTLAIHTGQQDSADNTDAAAQPQAVAPPRATQTARPVPPKPVPSAPQGGGQGGPMSIVPSQAGGDTTTRTALARPTQAAEPAPSSHGTFVQVTSRRTEAEAQTEYRNLQAKYPSQLGGHTSTVRQVSLGDKGTFYRALVGPFASMEQATQMCSSLKAAGGNCIVQRN
jgi:cell division protein FtsN